MCYVKPGPRCSVHIGQQLTKARKLARQSPDPTNIAAVSQLSAEYDCTRKGQKLLSAEIASVNDTLDSLPDNSSSRSQLILDKEVLEHRLAVAQDRYTTQMKAYRQSVEDAKELLGSEQRVTSMTTQQEPYSYEIDAKLEKLVRQRLSNQLPVAQVKRMVVDKHTPFTAVFGSRSFDITSDYRDDITQHHFSYGQCANIAYELHRQTGKPIILFTDKDVEGGWQGHAGVLLDNGDVLDITGDSSHEEIKRRYSTIKNFDVTVVNRKEFLDVMQVPQGIKLPALETAIVNKLCRDIVQDYVSN